MHQAGTTVFRISLLLSAVILVIACSRGLPVPFPAPDFTVEDVFTEDEIQLSELKGSPVLIYFLASW